MASTDDFFFFCSVLSHFNVQRPILSNDSSLESHYFYLISGQKPQCKSGTLQCPESLPLNFINTSRGGEYRGGRPRRRGVQNKSFGDKKQGRIGLFSETCNVPSVLIAGRSTERHYPCRCTLGVVTATASERCGRAVHQGEAKVRRRKAGLASAEISSGCMSFL